MARPEQGPSDEGRRPARDARGKRPAGDRPQGPRGSGDRAGRGPGPGRGPRPDGRGRRLDRDRRAPAGDMPTIGPANVPTMRRGRSRGDRCGRCPADRPPGASAAGRTCPAYRDQASGPAARIARSRPSGPRPDRRPRSRGARGRRTPELVRAPPERAAATPSGDRRETSRPGRAMATPSTRIVPRVPRVVAGPWDRSVAERPYRRPPAGRSPAGRPPVRRTWAPASPDAIGAARAHRRGRGAGGGSPPGRGGVRRAPPGPSAAGGAGAACRARAARAPRHRAAHPGGRGRGRLADRAHRLRRAPGHRAGRRATPLGHHRRRPRRGRRTRRATLRARAGLARGPPERGHAAAQRRGVRGARRGVPDASLGAHRPGRHQGIRGRGRAPAAGAARRPRGWPGGPPRGVGCGWWARTSRHRSPIATRTCGVRWRWSWAARGRGIAGHIRRRLDLVVRIPMHGRVGSLNAAVAGSVLLFEAAAQRPTPVRPPSPAPGSRRRLPTMPAPASTRDRRGLRTRAGGRTAPRPRTPRPATEDARHPSAARADARHRGRRPSDAPATEDAPPPPDELLPGEHG